MTTTTTKKPAAAKAGKPADVVSIAQDNAKKASAQAYKGYEDLLQFNKDTLEAVVKSSQLLARGMQDVGKAVLGVAQESVEDTVAASRAIAGAKTLKELIDVQAGFAKANLDKLILEGGRISEISAKVAQDALAPINARVNGVVEKLVKQA